MKSNTRIYCHKPTNTNIRETSCIEYINKHSIEDYMQGLMLYVLRTVSENSKSSIPGLESNYEHIFSFWFSKAFEKWSDNTVAEVLLTLLADAIGWMRAEHKMDESPAIHKCLGFCILLDKDDLELTDKEFMVLLRTNNVLHRMCDVCGCELAMPDRGKFSRKVIQTMACTACTNTKQHTDLLIFIDDLRKKHDKATVIEIMDARMQDTWGEGNVFTEDEWKEQT